MGRRRDQMPMICFLILCVPLVTSQLSDDEATAETPSCPPLNSCPIRPSKDAISRTPSTAEPPPPAKDLHPVPDLMGNQELSTVTLAEAVALALLTAKKGERKQWKIFFILIFPSAVFVIIFWEIPLRDMFPRFAQMMERFVVIFFVNGVISLLLPSKFLWVPAICFGFSLLASIGFVPRLI